MIALTQAAVYGVDPDKAGIASALLNSAQQIGVALGLAILSGIAANVTAATRNATLSEAEALVTGYGVALTVAAGILLGAGILALAKVGGAGEVVRVNTAVDAMHQLTLNRE